MKFSDLSFSPSYTKHNIFYFSGKESFKYSFRPRGRTIKCYLYLVKNINITSYYQPLANHINNPTDVPSSLNANKAFPQGCFNKRITYWWWRHQFTKISLVLWRQKNTNKEEQRHRVYYLLIVGLPFQPFSSNLVLLLFICL